MCIAIDYNSVQYSVDTAQTKFRAHMTCSLLQKYNPHVIVKNWKFHLLSKRMKSYNHGEMVYRFLEPQSSCGHTVH